REKLRQETFCGTGKSRVKDNWGKLGVQQRKTERQPEERAAQYDSRNLYRRSGRAGNRKRITRCDQRIRHPLFVETNGIKKHGQ
ncbi:hypothetical protein, partial [Pseudomonas aeruginosa]|uniref:hypothetical protein n=1 Tax=Pseudomonas aeruginosa TaxID=287 RepID=UPI003FD3F917